MEYRFFPGILEQEVQSGLISFRKQPETKISRFFLSGTSCLLFLHLLSLLVNLFSLPFYITHLLWGQYEFQFPEEEETLSGFVCTISTFGNSSISHYKYSSWALPPGWRRIVVRDEDNTLSVWLKEFLIYFLIFFH